MAKIERTKNATRNVIFGFLLKFYQIVLPFLMRTVIIHYLGVEYLGLSSLFTSILQVLNLAELGIGVAMIFSMYEPIANDDEDKICALLNLYKKYYFIIGLTILILGLILCPFLPYLITGTVPNNINLYILYFMNLVSTVLTYWMLSYKQSIAYAYQRIDVLSKVQLITETIKYIIQIAAIIYLKNYYVFVIGTIISQIFTNILISNIIDKMYPNIKAKGSLDKIEVKKINGRIKDLFTSKVGAVIINSSGNIVVSAFLGLYILAIYQNYYYILTAVIGVLAIIFNSCTAGIGNSLLVETNEKNYNDFKKFTFMIVFISTICACCFLTLYQPFMEIWVGNELVLDNSCVTCLCVYFYIYEINALLNLYKDAAGIWHEDRFRPLITALVNLALSIILVNVIGIYGVILSTVISMLFVGIPWILHNIFTIIFKNRLKDYLLDLTKYTVITILISCLTVYIVSFLPSGGYINFAIRLIVTGCVSTILLTVIYFNNEQFKKLLIMLKEIIKKF